MLRGLSVEMRVSDEEWEVDGTISTRTVQAADLRGLAIVDRPAYGDSHLADSGTC